MVRVRNEETTLEESILSLFPLTIPHEIVIILHCCTDRSADIAHKLAAANSNIKIFTYNVEISRAGYETLATDATSGHSLPFYYNWYLARCSLPWKFKWDGDFIASPALIEWLNSAQRWTHSNFCYKIKAISDDSINSEPYLLGSIVSYRKYLFWEIPTYSVGYYIMNAPDSVFITHKSVLTDIKPYWHRIPWYKTEDCEEARTVATRVQQLIDEFGEPPAGLARASNPACDNFFRKIMRAKPTYVNLMA